MQENWLKKLKKKGMLNSNLTSFRNYANQTEAMNRMRGMLEDEST